MSEAHVQIEKGSEAIDGKRGQGRPRDARVDARVLDATLELLADRGLGALTMEAVAQRAGVSKATIYRRWPSRDHLVAAAFASISEPIAIPDTGNVRDDLMAMVTGLQERALRSLRRRCCLLLLRFG